MPRRPPLPACLGRHRSRSRRGSSRAGSAALDGYRLIVQAKLRTTTHGTVAGVKRLLEHGEAGEPAAERLKDPRARYLLVTSAGLNGEATNFRARHAGNCPNVAAIPRRLQV